MMTAEDVRQLCCRLSLELTGAEDCVPAEDVGSIVYRVDVTGCGGEVFTDRHIDIEYIFGDYFEVSEDMPLFQWLCTKYALPEAELCLWQTGDE